LSSQNKNPTPHQPLIIINSLLLPPRSALLIAPHPFAAALQYNHHALLLLPFLNRGGPFTAKLRVIHFQGHAIRQVSCYTLLSGCQLPWPPSCCQDHTTPFLHKLEHGHFKNPFGSSRIAGSAYQKRPTEPQKQVPIRSLPHHSFSQE
jgi:hypothetical protein